MSPGVAIGRAFVLDDARALVRQREIEAHEVAEERTRLDQAIRESIVELDELRETAKRELGNEAAKIFLFHQGILQDPSVTAPAHELIARDLVGAEYAVQEVCRALADRFASMSDEAFRTKVDDVLDVERRLLSHLVGAHADQLATISEDVVVLARDMTPTQAASIPRQHVRAFATDTGGPTSHMAIFARALGIPAVGGLRHISSEVREGDLVIIDGDAGAVVVNPSEETLERYQGYIRASQAFHVGLAELSQQESRTKCGAEIALLGNIELADETQKIVAAGGHGVGLFRTEFLWLTGNREPTEDEQAAVYIEAVRQAQGRPVCIRTFDLGADKYTQERARFPERNPFLGLRSIRYCLQHLRMFRAQLRAILRASAEGPVKIMFPLITNTSELRQAKLVLDDVKEELSDRGVPFDPHVAVGMMVETPSAAIMAPTFAKLADFFSIGTNDLVQYTLAVDRTNELVASLYNPAHPAVLRLIRQIVRSGNKANIDVSICGEVAGDPEYTMLLMGLGLRTLSMSPSRIPLIKRVVRSVTIEECERLARAAGAFDSERRVAAYLREQALKYVPEVLDGRSVTG